MNPAIDQDMFFPGRGRYGDQKEIAEADAEHPHPQAGHAAPRRDNGAARRLRGRRRRLVGASFCRRSGLFA